MKSEEKIRKFFKLEEEQDLFGKAIKPPSCGGGKEFKHLASRGDKVLDQAFDEIMIEKGIIDTGIITRHRGEFHNEETLSSLGYYLGIDSIMNPSVVNQTIQENYVKESELFGLQH